MRALVLHLLVLAIIVGVPAFDRWARFHYDLSIRWGTQCRKS